LKDAKGFWENQKAGLASMGGKEGKEGGGGGSQSYFQPTTTHITLCPLVPRGGKGEGGETVGQTRMKGWVGQPVGVSTKGWAQKWGIPRQGGAGIKSGKRDRGEWGGGGGGKLKVGSTRKERPRKKSPKKRTAGCKPVYKR